MSSFPNLRSPLACVDIIIESEPGKIVLVQRASPPHGWALPGGFVDYGESSWQAAVREAKEETSLSVELLEQLYSYSDPQRDPRCHTITTVYVGKAEGEPFGKDDATIARAFPISELPPLAFDHADIVKDYVAWKNQGIRPGPVRRFSKTDTTTI